MRQHTRTLAIATALLFGYPGAALMLAHLGIVKIPSLDIVPLNASAQVENDNRYRGPAPEVLFEQAPLLDLAAAVVDLAAEELGASGSSWKYDVRPVTGLVTGTHVIIAHQQTSCDQAADGCDNMQLPLTLFVLVTMRRPDSARAVVSWLKGPADYSRREEWVFEAHRPDSRWVVARAHAAAAAEVPVH